MSFWRYLIVYVLHKDFLLVQSAANAANTEITSPISGILQNSSILNTVKSTFIVTAKDSDGNLAGDSELIWAELNKEGTCEVGYGSISCQTLCYPFTTPHETAKQCLSSYHTKGRVTKTSDTALWAIANVEATGSSTYTVTYHESIELSDYYIATVYLLTKGGLYGRYWDNIWFTGTEALSGIATEINYQWGTNAAITTYGTDYVSARWEGKLQPPYNETYKFYLYADDGSRLWIDKQLIIDGWDECCNETWGAVNLTSYTFHDIIVEYKEIRADAYIELRWSSDSISKSIVPSKYLYHQAHVLNSPFDASPILILPGNVSYEQTAVNDESPFEGNIAGVNNSVFITATDAFGHVLNTDTAIFNMTNLNGMDTIQEWQGSGQYKITFMSLEKTATAGEPFYIQLNDNDILNSPYTVSVSPAATSPLNTTLGGSGLVSAVAGYSAKFNLTVFDEYGNERETGDDIITLRFYGAAAGHGYCGYQTVGTGLYICTYTLTTTGTYTPEITINDVILPYSTAISVSAGAIHGPTCDILNPYDMNTTLAAGYSEYIIIQSRDQFGNALSGTSDSYEITISDGSNEIISTLSSIGSGQYNLTFTPSIAGSYNVNILLNNATHIADSPYTLTVIPGDPVASTSSVLSGTGHVSAQSLIESDFIVQLRDLYNNDLVSDVTGSIFNVAQLACPTTNTSVVCSYYQSGQYQCKYTPTECGSCTLSIKMSGANIANSPFSVAVSPGSICAIHSQVHGISDGTAGSTQSFIIVSQDMAGNNLTSGGHQFTAKLVDEHSIHSDVVGQVTDNTDGTYTVSYVTEDANVYEALSVELMNVGGLMGNYFTDYSFTNVFPTHGENVIDSVISFDYGHDSPLDASASFPASDYFSIRWIGYLYPPYSETYTIYTSIYAGTGIRLYLNNDLLIDQFDPLDGASDPFVIIQLSANTFYDFQIDLREQSGACKVSLEWESASIERVPIASNYLYYVQSLGDEVDESNEFVATVSIVPSNTLASACIVSGDGTAVAIAGHTTTLSITARDSYENVQTHAGNEASNFKLYILDEVSNRINGSIVHSGNNGDDGLYTATYTVTNTSKQYTLYITFNGALVASSPYAITVSPGDLDGTQSSAVLTDGRAGELQTFSLFVRDTEANMITDRAVTVSLILNHIQSGSTLTTTDIVDNNNGVYTIKYNATKSGEYGPNITMNGTVLNSVTSAINISEAIASASKSFIKGWENGAIGSIASAANIEKEIQLLDIYSNVISVEDGYNFYVILKSSNESIVGQSVIVPQVNGTYSFNFSAPYADTMYLSVMLASGDINSADGLTGEYFNNRWLHSSPYNSQIDDEINMDFGDGLITETAKNFISIRWTGYVKPAFAETYSFSIASDDGSRLYIDDELLFDDFLSNSGVFVANYTFSTANLLYPIRIEYRENTGNASIVMQWQSPSQSLEIVPKSALFSSASHIMSSPFTLTVT